MQAQKPYKNLCELNNVNSNVKNSVNVFAVNSTTSAFNDKMTSKEEKQISAVIDTSLGSNHFNNSLEAVRKCTNPDSFNTSWDKNYYATLYLSTDDRNKIPPFESIMVSDTLSPEKTNSSCQTDDLMQQGDIVDVSLSFSKDFSIQESSNENSDYTIGNKRYRRDSVDADKSETRPLKKSKRTDSCSSSASDLPLRLTSDLLSSTSDTSFKSISSHYSYKKIRKRRMKSDSNLFRNLLRSRKTFGSNTNLSEKNLTGNFSVWITSSNIIVLQIKSNRKPKIKHQNQFQLPISIPTYSSST